MLKFKLVNRFFAIVLGVVLLLTWKAYLPLYSFLIVIACWVLVTFLGATNIRWNYFFVSLCKQEMIDKKAVALTFDDGPSENTLEILKVLRKYDVKATFFCIGHKIDEHPEIFRQILEEGHQVGNHSYSHASTIGFFSTKALIEEYTACNKAAKSHGNVEMKLFRPPFGVTNPKIKSALKATGLQPMGWSIRSYDALFKSENFIFKQTTTNVKSGDVFLLHDTKPHSIAVLERLLLFLQKRNFKLLPLGSLFNIDVYH